MSVAFDFSFCKQDRVEGAWEQTAGEYTWIEEDQKQGMCYSWTAALFVAISQ
jgi:hypothetical protein